MNPNVINIFSNDDLIKSIEIDHEVKNNNTNSFDELLHKVDSEKVFSEDKPINTSHEKTEVENSIIANNSGYGIEIIDAGFGTSVTNSTIAKNSLGAINNSSNNLNINRN